MPKVKVQLYAACTVGGKAREAGDEVLISDTIADNFGKRILETPPADEQQSEADSDPADDSGTEPKKKKK